MAELWSKIVEFFSQTIAITGFDLPYWGIAAGVAALLLIVIIIAAAKKSKKKKIQSGEATVIKNLFIRL